LICVSNLFRSFGEEAPGRDTHRTTTIPPPVVTASGLRTGLAGHRWFESGFLQWRVECEHDLLDHGWRRATSPDLRSHELTATRCPTGFSPRRLLAGAHTGGATVPTPSLSSRSSSPLPRTSPLARPPGSPPEIGRRVHRSRLGGAPFSARRRQRQACVALTKLVTPTPPS
jgi:hypothetical protein